MRVSRVESVLEGGRDEGWVGGGLEGGVTVWHKGCGGRCGRGLEMRVW